MSSPTQPMTQAGRSAAESPPTFASELARDEWGTAIDVARMAPPPELLEQMARADEIGQTLRESGREIAFSCAGERLLGIELRDGDGEPIRRLSAVEAVEIAAGRAVE